MQILKADKRSMQTIFSIGKINLKYLITLLFALFIAENLKAQLLFSTYTDVGETNVSEGLYVTTAVSGTYVFDKTKIETGGQFDLKSANSNLFSGVYLRVSRDLPIKKFPIDIQGFFLYNPFSDLIHETNWGLSAYAERSHFSFRLGTEFRTYFITQEALENYTIETDKSLHENWNIMYSLGYQLKPPDYKWNVGLAVTNIDHFIINQETNPMFYLRGKYKTSLPLTLYVESWYKPAGVMNISVNYFGFFIRTGLIWELNIK